MSGAPQVPRTRVVLLGASNLTLSLPAAVELVRGSLPAPVELLVADGLGRSYGRWSRVLARELPGVRDTGLWSALDAAAEKAPAPTYALATDVGNDLAYGETAETVAGWVETCLVRCARHDARATLTRLPIMSLADLGPTRFGLVRAVLFPSHAVTFDGVRTEALELDTRLGELAVSHAIATVTPPRHWYGFDPIHVTRARRDEAWRAILGAWGVDLVRRRSTAGEARRVRAAAAAARRVWGRERRSETPQVTFEDGSTLSVY